jgi:hypothetical protein
LQASTESWDEREQKLPFFCGFHACLEVVDALAIALHENQEDESTGMDALHAEYERFATQHDCGDLSINH